MEHAGDWKKAAAFARAHLPAQSSEGVFDLEKFTNYVEVSQGKKSVKIGKPQSELLAELRANFGEWSKQCLGTLLVAVEQTIRTLESPRSSHPPLGHHLGHRQYPRLLRRADGFATKLYRSFAVPCGCAVCDQRSDMIDSNMGTARASRALETGLSGMLLPRACCRGRKRQIKFIRLCKANKILLPTRGPISPYLPFYCRRIWTNKRYGNMDAMVNPYDPPISLRTNVGSFARRYRVDASKTTLREFRNLSGKPILGTVFWIAMQARLLRFDKQIIDGPRPFAEDQSSPDELRDPVRTRLLAIADSAEELGFHCRSYYASDSTGVEVHGGAIRMLHDSGQSFLQILASSSGSTIQGHEIIVSATATPVTVFASTNGPPSYNTPAGVTTQRRVGVSLHELCDVHAKSMSGMENLICFRSFSDVALVMDHLSILFFTDKISRGIFVPEP